MADEAHGTAANGTDRVGEEGESNKKLTVMLVDVVREHGGGRTRHPRRRDAAAVVAEKTGDGELPARPYSNRSK